MSTFNRTYRAPKFFLCIHITDDYHIELEKAENRHSYYSFICRGAGILHILKDGKFKTAYLLNGFEFIDCELSGNIENSGIYGGTVEGAQILRSQLYKGCEVKDSKIESSYVHGSCTLTNCFVFGRDGIFKGKMVGGIFREGGIGKHARFDDTEIVVSTKINT